MSTILIAAVFCALPPGPVVKLMQGGHYATGTVIGFKDGDGVILTCYHGFHDEEKPVEVVIQRNAKSEGKIIAMDEQLDVMLVKAPVGRGVRAIELLGGEPKEGKCVIAGYGRGEYLERRSEIKEIGTNGWMSIEAKSRPGDSGGPILEDGRYAGMQLRHDDRRGDGYGRSISVLRYWIEQNRPRNLF